MWFKKVLVNFWIAKSNISDLQAILNLANFPEVLPKLLPKLGAIPASLISIFFKSLSEISNSLKSTSCTNSRKGSGSIFFFDH